MSLDLGYILARSCRLGLIANAISERGLRLCEKCWHHQQKNDKQAANPDLHHGFAYIFNGRNERFVLGLVNPFVEEQRQCRQEHHDANEAEQNSFDQINAQVEPISNFMNDSAMNPKKVVDALAAIAEKELFIASRIASCGSATFFR